MVADFTEDNMVVLVGPNGCGKSTLLGFCRWQLTQKLPDAHPTRDDFRRRVGTEPATPSGGVGTYEVGGHIVEIESWLHITRWKLKIDGNDKATGATAVAAELAKLMRLDVKIVQRYGFIQQGALRDVLFGQRAKRMENFVKLIGADTAEPAREILRGVVNAIEAPDLVEEIRAAEVAQAQVQTQVDAADKEVAETQAIINGIALGAEQHVLGRRDEAIASRASLTQIDSQIERVRKDHAEYVQAIGSAKSNESGWRVEAEKLAEPARLAQTAIDNHRAAVEEYGRYVAAVNHLKQLKQQQLDNTLTLLPDPPPPNMRPAPVKPGNYDEVKASLPKLDNTLIARQTGLDNYKNAKIGACPVCGVDCACCTENVGGPRDPEWVETLSRSLNDARSAQYEAHQVVDGWDSAYADWENCMALLKRDHETEWNRVQAENRRLQDVHDVQEKAISERLTEANTALHQFQTTEEPVLDKARLQADVDKHQAATEHQRTWQHTLAAKEQLCSNAQATLDHLNNQRGQEQAVVDSAPSPDEIATADSRVRIHQTNNSKLTALVDSVERLRPLLDTRNTELAALHTRQERNLKLTQFRQSLETMRGVLHRDRLPARVVAGYMRILVARVNDLLPRFGAKFLIFTEDTEFMARKTDGTEIAAHNLSGGEACRWCISFLLAVHQLFATDLGLLALDEPTDGLDDAGKEAFGVAMSQLQDILRETRTQMFIATHAEPLTVGAERVVDVQELVRSSISS